MRARTLLCAALLGCGAQPAPRDTRLNGDEALVVRKGELQAIQVDGTAVSLLESSATQCVADPRGQVVFLLERTRGQQSYQVRMLDLQTWSTATVVTGLPRVDVLVVEHQGYGAVNPAETFPHRMAAVLQLGPTPGLVGRPGAGATDGTIPGSLASLKARVEATPIQAQDQLELAFRRNGARPIWQPEPAVPQPPRVRVPLEHCHEPTKCEVANVLPGTPFWSVVTRNEKTDVYGQTLSWRQFFDPRDGHFFDPASGERSRRPLGSEADIERLLISASGAAMMRYGEVITFGQGVLVDGALPCGFVGGGWIVGGWPFR